MSNAEGIDRPAPQPPQQAAEAADVVDIELALRPAGADYRAELRCTLPGTDAPISAAAALQIDPVRLRSLALDPTAYGLALGGMVLVGGIATAFAQARAVAQQSDLPLRLRLALAADATDLHALRWETLRDSAQSEAPLLTTGAQVLFSRFLGSSDWLPVRPEPKGALRALVVLASPPDLPDFSLSPLDLEAERALAEACFAPIPTRVLGRGQASLDGLAAQLHDGYDMLYLLAHGRVDETGETWVYLEGEDGLTKAVLGRALAERVAELRERPQLIILGSCESAGSLLALGPRLVQAGVGAVLAMQDRITLDTLRRFLSECLGVLLQEGQIDQAVAMARGVVRERPDFWVPVLFLRSQSGRLWAASDLPPAPDPPAADRTPTPTAPASADPSHGALTMPTPHDVADQNDHLARARQNVQTLLKQIAGHGGESHAPLNLLNSLTDARREIARRKRILRGWGAPVEDHPDDGDARPAAAAGSAASAGQGNFISGGTFYGPVIAHQENRGGTAPGHTPARQADVLLVTVTDGETRAVFGALQTQTGQRPQPLYRGDKTYYDLGRVGGARVWLVRSEAGSMTVGGSFSTLYAAIDTLSPAAVLLVGIAFGTNPAAQRLGDVLVAKQLAPYEPQRVSTGPAGEERLIPRGDRVTVSTRVLDRCRDGALSWPAERARVRFGLVLSGEKLLDHAPTVAALLGQEPEAVGGEMEGAGLYVAAAQRGVAWGLVKAVCDWADGSKGEGDEEGRQEQAAGSAAAFALHVLAAGGFAPEAWQG